MTRPPRLIVPDEPLHITQRGVDRGPTFFADEDFGCYRMILQEASEEAGCSVHAYVLMTNHVHLLITPRTVEGPAQLMRALGQRYVPYFNHRYRRTGTLWEGRYRSEHIDTTHYLFACSRYIERNPLRAGLVDDPACYVWSSHGHNALGRRDPIVTPHADYDALGPDAETRRRAYRAMFDDGDDPAEVARLRVGLRRRPRLHASLYRQLSADLTL